MTELNQKLTKHSQKTPGDDPRRKGFFEKITRFMSKLIQYAPIDGAADQVSTFLLRYSVQLAPGLVLVCKLALLPGTRCYLAVVNL